MYKNESKVDEDIVRSNYYYESVTGLIKRKRYLGLHGKFKKDTVAGSLSNEGYLSIWVDGWNILAHRIAWFLHYGEWPKKYIDHINGNRADNRIENLRESTMRENNQNMNKHRKGSLLGTYFDKRRNKWIAQYTLNRKHHFIGYFSTAEEAHCAYIDVIKNIDDSVLKELRGEK